MDAAEFRIDAGPVGARAIVVNGEDVTDRVTAWQVAGRDGSATGLILHVAAGGTIEGQGVVQVVPPDYREELASILDHLDPKAVEEKVLEAMQWGDDSVVKATMDYVKGLLRGEPAAARS